MHIGSNFVRLILFSFWKIVMSPVRFYSLDLSRKDSGNEFCFKFPLQVQFLTRIPQKNVWKFAEVNLSAIFASLQFGIFQNSLGANSVCMVQSFWDEFTILIIAEAHASVDA